MDESRSRLHFVTLSHYGFRRIRFARLLALRGASMCLDEVDVSCGMENEKKSAGISKPFDTTESNHSQPLQSHPGHGTLDRKNAALTSKLRTDLDSLLFTLGVCSDYGGTIIAGSGAGSAEEGARLLAAKTLSSRLDRLPAGRFYFVIITL